MAGNIEVVRGVLHVLCERLRGLQGGYGPRPAAAGQGGLMRIERSHARTTTRRSDDISAAVRPRRPLGRARRRAAPRGLGAEEAQAAGPRAVREPLAHPEPSPRDRGRRQPLRSWSGAGASATCCGKARAAAWPCSTACSSDGRASCRTTPAASGDRRARARRRAASASGGPRRSYGLGLARELTYELQLSWAGPEPGASTTSPLEDVILNWDASKDKRFQVAVGQFKVPARPPGADLLEPPAVRRPRPALRRVHAGPRRRRPALGPAGQGQGRVPRGHLQRQPRQPARQRQRQVPVQRAADVPALRRRAVLGERLRVAGDQPLLARGRASSSTTTSTAPPTWTTSTRAILGVDAVFKYRGLSLFAEYFARHRTPETGDRRSTRTASTPRPATSCPRPARGRGALGRLRSLRPHRRQRPHGGRAAW